MDEELEQRGVTPESFFDQATETREMVQTVQKTSNSNLSLLNELKERVRKIEIKLFDEEDRRQKEEMEAKVKEQNEKSQGSGGGSKEGGEDGGGGQAAQGPQPEARGGDVLRGRPRPPLVVPPPTPCPSFIVC